MIFCLRRILTAGALVAVVGCNTAVKQRGDLSSIDPVPTAAAENSNPPMTFNGTDLTAIRAAAGCVEDFLWLYQTKQMQEPFDPRRPAPRTPTTPKIVTVHYNVGRIDVRDPEKDNTVVTFEGGLQFKTIALEARSPTPELVSQDPQSWVCKRIDEAAFKADPRFKHDGLRDPFSTTVDNQTVITLNILAQAISSGDDKTKGADFRKILRGEDRIESPVMWGNFSTTNIKFKAAGATKELVVKSVNQFTGSGLTTTTTSEIVDVAK